MKDQNCPLIVLLASSETSPAVLYGLYDVLASAGSGFMEMVTGVPGEEILDIKIVAASHKPFRCFGNIMVEPHASIDDIDHPDAVVVCDMYTPINQPPRGTYPREVEWLKKVYANNALLTSVCSGSAVLAETGLLDGLEVSGHWAYRHMYRQFYPKSKWQEASILNLSAEHKRIITTGGVTAWQDLAIYLINRFGSAQHAINSARLHLLSPHTDGQLPFASMTQSKQHDDALISDCQDWIIENYNCTNPVARMSDRTRFISWLSSQLSVAWVTSCRTGSSTSISSLLRVRNASSSSSGIGASSSCGSSSGVWNSTRASDRKAVLLS